MSAPLRLLVLGAGRMGTSQAKDFAQIPGVQIVAAVDATPGAAATLADLFGARSFEALEEALDWGGFDAATNVTPDAVHHPTTLQLLAAGKHVLCEKPLATNYADAAEMTAAAEAAGVVNMVNLSYRKVAGIHAARAMVAEGRIGALRHIEASYLQSWLTQPAWGDWQTESAWLWRLSTAHGSKGVLGDVGIHILDFASFGAMSDVRRLGCRLTTFDKAPDGRIGEYTLDANDSFTMLVELENGAAGTVTASRFASGHLNDLTLRLHGTEGGIEVSYVNDVSRLYVCEGPDLTRGRWREVDTPAVTSNYARFVEAIRGSGPADPSFARGAALQKALDAAETSHADGSRMLDLA